jgi:acetamidase/formamidase
LIRVRPGEKFIIETEDANNNRIRTKEDLPVPEILLESSRNEFNPVGGPVYVEGAEKGDILIVTICDIIPDKQGNTGITPDLGPLRDSGRWPSCREPYTHIIEHLPGKSGTTSDGKALFNDKISWDLHPFIGTLGVAPIRPTWAGSDTVTGQGSWGGNYDCRDICKGTKVYLPVFHEGALFFAGDVHGSQADGEFAGWGNETRAELVLSCGIMKKKTIPFPRLETENSIIQLNVDKPLEKAVTQAFLWLIEWLVQEYAFDPREAYVLLTVDPLVRINVYQMVDMDKLRYTVGVQFPKSHLRGGTESRVE